MLFFFLFFFLLFVGSLFLFFEMVFIFFFSHFLLRKAFVIASVHVIKYYSIIDKGLKEKTKKKAVANFKTNWGRLFAPRRQEEDWRHPEGNTASSSRAGGSLQRHGDRLKLD